MSINILAFDGDGIGPDIWRATSNVIDNAIKIAYNDEKSIEWLVRIYLSILLIKL